MFVLFVQLLCALCTVSLATVTADSKQCGLPANLDELPDFAQDEIRSIWRDYVPGHRCEKEQTITEDILTVLAMFDKELTSHGTGKSGAKELAKLLPAKATTFSDETLPGDGPGLDIDPVSTESPAHESPTKVEFPYKAKNAKIPASSAEVRPQRLRKISPPHYVEYDYLEDPKNSGKFRPMSNIDDVHYNKKHQITKDYEIDIEGQQQPPLGKKFFHHKNDAGQFEFVKRLPFLQEANPEVVEVFMEVMEDPDIPSEGRRMEELHLLAVSYLNSHQLDEFNQWSTIRRKRIQSRERQLHNLSPRARAALRRLALAADMDQARAQLQRIEPTLRDELQSWGKSRERAEH